MPAAWRTHVPALLAYALVAVAFAWPLPTHMRTFLPGPPDGDAGVYVWNQWVFHHEIVVERSNPYVTSVILAPTGPAFLSLHNYTEALNVLALPLIGPLGVVPAFNLVYLLLGIATAYAMFQLARTLGAGGKEAWLAGVLFAWSPMLIARGATHLSLTAAAPLPLFVLALLRAERDDRLRNGLLLGGTAALAAFCDAYYAVYCGLIAMSFVAARSVRIEPRTGAAGRWLLVMLDVLLVAVLAGTIAIAATGGWTFGVAGRTFSFRTLYTPGLILAVLALLRVTVRYRITLALSRDAARRVTRIASAAALAALVLLAPRLYGLTVMADEVGVAAPPTLWRSSPPGVDVLALILPNPSHPLAPPAWRAWLTSLSSGFEENVASIPLVALGVLIAARRGGWRAPRPWGVLGVWFLLLALGPFVRVDGFTTGVPGPWALLRYAPVIELARSPTRFTVLVLLVVAPLFALALSSLRARGMRPVTFLLVGGLLLFELFPAPRILSSAAIPRVYAQVADDPRPIRLLELPFGLRDGTSSAGDFSALTQYFQTSHHKAVLGGYLSRVSPQRLRDLQAVPVLDALLQLSEGRDLPPDAADAAAPGARALLEDSGIAYVVIDRGRASPALVAYAVRAFGLELIEVDGRFALYRPGLAALARDGTQ